LVQFGQGRLNEYLTQRAAHEYRGAAEQGVEADEAWSTSELRSLTPVFGGHEAEMRVTVLLVAVVIQAVIQDTGPLAR